MKKTNKNFSFFSIIPLLLIIVIAGLLIYCSMGFLYFRSYPKTYESYVNQYAQTYMLDTNLVYAVIRSESRFNKDAVSSIGACGLMQITEETFQWANQYIEDKDQKTYDLIFDPQVNIQYGCCILKILLSEFQDEKTALAAYHAGWGNVKKWLDNPSQSQDGKSIDEIPFKNTKAYVNQVMHSQQIYQQIYQRNHWLQGGIKNEQ